MNPRTVQADAVVYGATPAGITAALQLKSRGYAVIIAEFSRHIGGISASGLGATDLGAEPAVGGYARQFYKEVAGHYGVEKQFTFEPHVAQRIFTKWLTEADIPVYTEQHLQQVYTNSGVITAISMEDGTRFEAKVWLDCSYEGDLMAMAGVSYKVGREANSTYKEIYNGIQFGAPHHKFEKWIDPYVIEGDTSSGLLHGITEDSSQQLGFQGQGDHRIQAYNFRICLTTVPNKLAFPKPPNYDATKYELLLRYIQSGVWDALKLHTPLPNDKTDLNNYGAFSTDYIGMNYDWPDGSYRRREEIFQAHLSYVMGLLYFLTNDNRVPLFIRQQVSKYGLPLDEFKDTHHWPHQLYIREARRMISDVIMTDHYPLQQKFVHDSIGLASFHMDSHNCRRMVVDGRVVNEGDVQVAVSPFAISYQAIRPKREECENLLVPVCLSASHIAYGSIRMEPVFMIIGQSAGMAAALALDNNCAVQQVSYARLRALLEQAGQVLDWDTSIQDDPLARMKETFGKV